jgi:hypothetical protein
MTESRVLAHHAPGRPPSIAGFAALLFSSVSGLAQLGVYSIAGLVAAALVTRFVLPDLLPARFHIRDVSAFGAWLARAVAAVPRGRWIVAFLAIAATAVLLLHRGKLWDLRIESLNPISIADRQLDAKLREALGASDARHVIAVRGADAQSALEAAERMGEKLDALASEGRIGGYESPARFLPSATRSASASRTFPPRRAQAAWRQRCAAYRSRRATRSFSPASEGEIWRHDTHAIHGLRSRKPSMGFFSATARASGMRCWDFDVRSTCRQCGARSRPPVFQAPSSSTCAPSWTRSTRAISSERWSLPPWASGPS